MGRTTTAPRGARTGLDGLLASPWAYALLALAAAIVYWQAPKYPLGRFDEDSILMPNMEYLVKTATVGDVIMRDAFFRPTGKVFYRPVQNVSYLIDARIGKGKASTFTVTSIVLHALCCILLLVLLRQVGVRFGISPTFAFVLALFFTVNPLFVQAVAWTPGRGDLLLALFALGALVSYHRYCSDGSALWLSACGVLTTLAIFSKETGIVMLVLLPLWWLLMERDRTSVRHMLLGVAPGIIAAAVMFAMRAKIITEPTTTADFALVNLLSNLRVFPEISAKLFAPPLLQTMAGYTMLCTILGGIVLLGLGAASLVRGETSSRATALYGLAWYGAFLLPGALYTHRFGSAAYDYLEHRGYVPAIGLALVLFIVLGRLLRNVQPRIVTAAGGIVVVVFAALAMGHVRDFASATTFYDQTVRTNPASALARANRGQMRQAAGDIQGAMDDYTAALATYPDFIMAHFGLGNAYLNRQQYSEAIVHLRAALNLEPSLARLGVMIGNAYLGANNADSAALWYRFTYERDATDYESALNLGVIEARRGNWPAGRDLFTEATRRAPSQASAWMNLGIANQNLGLMSEACTSWQRAEQLGDAQAAELRVKNCR